MVNAQEWLDENFPQNEESGLPGYEGLKRNEIEVLDLRNEEGISITLEGSLKLVGFDNLEKLDCWEQKLTSLDISDCPNLTELNCSFNQEITKLDLSNSSNLVKLDCRCNKITKLDLSNCPELEELVCLHNRLVKLNLDNCKKLRSINFSHNHRKINDFNLIGCENLEEILG
jgi:Leucine-rich repeat (LRR) protein